MERLGWWEGRLRRRGERKLCCICFDILFDYERYELVGGWKEGVVIDALFISFCFVFLVAIGRCQALHASILE